MTNTKVLRGDRCQCIGCDKKVHALGLCRKHYDRQRLYGRTNLMRRENGSGTYNKQGYHVINNGTPKTVHRIIAENVLGKELPKNVEIHHIDGNKINNELSNLVICPSREYHMLLHRRERALNACGNPDWRKCCYCGKYDDPNNLKIYKTSPPRHSKCQSEYRKRRRLL